MSVTLRRTKVVLAGSALFGAAPRLETRARRVIRCDVCRSPLEMELEIDVGAASGHPVQHAGSIYDPQGDYTFISRGGATVLITNRHLGPTAPASRQCSGGYYVGASVQALYATLWQMATRMVAGKNARFQKDRTKIQSELVAAEEGGEAPQVRLPEGVERLFSEREINGKRPIEPMRILDAAKLDCVRTIYGKSEDDGFVYMIDYGAFGRMFSSPYAPELLVAQLGGEGGLRGPNLDYEFEGLVVRPLKRPEERKKENVATCLEPTLF